MLVQPPVMIRRARLVAKGQETRYGGLDKELKDDINKETAVTGHIHVCDAYAAPCDDPEQDGRFNW